MMCTLAERTLISVLFFIDSCMSIATLTLTWLPFKSTHVLSTNVHFISTVSMVTAPIRAVPVMQKRRCLWTPCCSSSYGPFELFSASPHTRQTFILRDSSACWGACFCLDGPIEWYFNFVCLPPLLLQYWGLSVLRLSGIMRSDHRLGGLGVARCRSVGWTGCLNRMLQVLM